MLIPVRRALLSVSDKTGIVPLARCLAEFGCELISTGGTGRELARAGLEVTEISRVTANPEAFGGRMKTISFEIESALLFDRERDAEEAQRLGIRPIDLVVANLYPFEEHLRRGAPPAGLIEQIDIGGPTMIRAAAKNFRWVAVATDPGQYEALEAELRSSGGSLGLETRRRLMRAAFGLTARYEAIIAGGMGSAEDGHALTLSFSGGRPLRYGENPHQAAAFYRQDGARQSLHDFAALSGKEISYNNILDIHAALGAVRELGRFGCAVVKHGNPCGLAEADGQRAALEAAWAGDPVSAYGSVLALNAPLAKDALTFLALRHEDRAQRKFVEVIVAPGFEPEALVELRSNKSLRAVVFDPRPMPAQRELRFLPGALLVQDADDRLGEEIRGVTSAAAAAVDRELVQFGVHAARQIKSNAIAVVRRRKDGVLQLVGMGAGQPNRLESTRLALAKCRENLARETPAGEIGDESERLVLVSDAFFPFADNLELIAEAGIRVVVEPGGSIRDDEVVRRAEELGLAVYLTGMRHFRH
jgi:phosphoribosylaminoimidazolecarboxamide formyltransferase / IMP cyclohydrolase